MTDRKQPSAAFWITVALVVVLVGYPLSIGPACWISSRMDTGESFISFVYRPLTWGRSESEQIDAAIDWYSELGSADGWSWVQDDDNGWGQHWQSPPAPWGGVM